MVGLLAVEVKPFGPVQIYVLPPVALKAIVPPVHTEVAKAVIVGVVLTVTLTVAFEVHPPTAVPVTLYTPTFTALALLIIGFCKVEVKPFGPVQIYVLPPVALNEIVPPVHTVLPEAVIVGVVLTVTLTVAFEVHPPTAVPVTL
jgi:hypothetical protein